MKLEDYNTFKSINIKKYVLLAIIQVIITFITVFVVLTLVNKYMGRMTIPNPMDSVSLANTFMVFVTFVLVAVTLVITMASIWFAKTLSEKKIDTIRDNIKDIVKTLLDEKDLNNDVFKEIMNQADVKKLLKEHIEELTKAQKTEFDNELKKKSEKMDEEIDNIKKTVHTIIDKKLQDSPNASALNEMLGGK